MDSAKGSDWVCIASGPSLTKEDVERARKYKTIVVNTSFRMAPWADVLFAGDFGWWNFYHNEVKRDFQGECWTGNCHSANVFGLRHIKQKHGHSLSTKRGVIHSGGNSGYSAIELAYQFGAKRIILLGYDMQRTNGMSHWHGDHQRLANGNAFPRWVKRIEQVASELEALGVEVLNATRETALSIKRITAENL